ncbi:uncharacterized protein L3040_005490 [Drepanopeziza brunnea f. sp. 'multigermtubi']|uniref:Telomere length regulation/capping, TEN1 n=1 Tax=Marssonina brunnea f. sp. multigermtubi (strain MB_m1) TaxID=1072389 RepID=K1WNG4_MARBU|nr:uncharacterized protein MBM_08098 [Drepanopeziza brunnea f. sp. 'multigermtubi' MB_m1]EKD13897.1 hypothetical protein MBM_08098 [Drepanopeziza brunnea f. sp. 'multigermtubi' MB_m1]KAJ5040931.1 hypothetical protein L3040_005490 [Drepanopeziza brunnea f. sp. 'multigermtubi']
MAGVQNGPIPTRLTLLSNLRNFSPGSKVRFLGCVTKYSTQTAILTLEHNHPPGNLLKAQVDVRLLVSTLKSNETQVGEWVHVMGYIANDQKPNGTTNRNLDVGIQAVVLWCAGPLSLTGYERSLDQRAIDERKNTGTR